MVKLTKVVLLEFFKMPVKKIISITVLMIISTLAEASVHRYHIRIDETITHAAVEACFDGQPPNYLAVESKKGLRDLVEFPKSEQGNIEIQGRYWKTKNLPDNACLNYKISLKRHQAKRSKSSAKRKNIAFIEENTWLWLPEVLPKSDDVELTFRIPKWAEISTPWRQPNFDQRRYLLGHQPQEWGYRLLIGDFNLQHRKIADNRYLNITTINGMPKQAAVNQWLVDVATSLKHYLGDYPQAQTQVIVISKPSLKRGPVPWGDVSRGNGLGILFVVVPTYDIEDFYTDWTAPHEFSHQLLPKVDYDDIWLSEGLASYLQNVLMGQSKNYSIEEAWSKIYQGLKRGEKGTKKVKPEPLWKTAGRRSRGGSSGRTMRIYWSGAIYFLKADIALREKSNGAVGLDDILLRLNRCCIDSQNTWTGERLAAQLDQLSSSRIFSDLYQQIAFSRDFPEFGSDFKKLGITINPSKKSSESAVVLKVEKNSMAWKIMQ